MSTRTRRSAALIVVSAAALVVLAGVGPASASCAMPPPLEEAVAAAPIAFVGTAEDVRDGTIARFRVEEIWAGPELVEVTIHGGEGEGAATSVDRSFREGERYLVLPHTVGADLRDNSCSSTQEWTEELAQHRPAEARMVDPAAVGSEATDREPMEVGASGLPLVLVTVAAAVLLAVGAWGLVRRAR